MTKETISFAKALSYSCIEPVDGVYNLPPHLIKRAYWNEGVIYVKLIFDDRLVINQELVKTDIIPGVHVIHPSTRTGDTFTIRDIPNNPWSPSNHCFNV